MGIEIVSSANVPAGTVIMVDADALVFALDPVSFDTSEVATVVDANADNKAPTMAGDGTPGGDLGTAGQVPADGGLAVSGNTTGTSFAAPGPVARSLWQHYMVGVRLVAPVSWGILRPGSIAQRTSVNW